MELCALHQRLRYQSLGFRITEAAHFPNLSSALQPREAEDRKNRIFIQCPRFGNREVEVWHASVWGFCFTIVDENSKHLKAVCCVEQRTSGEQTGDIFSFWLTVLIFCEERIKANIFNISRNYYTQMRWMSNKELDTVLK